ncbi:hypothetical protein A5834_001668 [Enterococcus faecium]|uniref:YesL family protein n=1 Tax=Enterococcus faecium TaxID=1352 RepID=UPI000B70F23B|nr:hypothetical protein A5834_001668 [Enterococcus faecium]
MMNRSIGKKANDYFLEIIEWIPRLIHLQLLWFLCVLPVFTLGTASRTVLYMIYHYKKNEEKKLGSLFWKKFRENFSLYGKQDSLASVYFLLLLIDYQIFRYWGGAVSYTHLDVYKRQNGFHVLSIYSYYGSCASCLFSH